MGKVSDELFSGANKYNRYLFHGKKAEEPFGSSRMAFYTQFLNRFFGRAGILPRHETAS
jgi:hypothetical protein